MTSYNITTFVTKNSGVCRVCLKKINSGDLIVRAKIDDLYSNQQFSVHVNCILDKIIGDVLKLKQKVLDDEIKRFKTIQKELEVKTR